jgi:hypothetical protein
MDTPAFPEATFRRAQSSLRVNLHDFNLIASRKLSAPLPGKGTAVAIPLLNVSAYGDPVPPSENVSLSEVMVEEVLLAPLSWCPHAEHMIATHLAGDSIVPTTYPGSILFVDTATRGTGKAEPEDHCRFSPRLGIQSCAASEAGGFRCSCVVQL